MKLIRNKRFYWGI